MIQWMDTWLWSWDFIQKTSGNHGRVINEEMFTCLLWDILCQVFAHALLSAWNPLPAPPFFYLAPIPPTAFRLGIPFSRRSHLIPQTESGSFSGLP